MSNSESNFEIRIEQRLFNKGAEGVIRKEYYDDWKQADAAYCAYRDLTKIKDSSILHVELIEHRKTIVHKAASKEVA